MSLESLQEFVHERFLRQKQSTIRNLQNLYFKRIRQHAKVFTLDLMSQLASRRPKHTLAAVRNNKMIHIDTQKHAMLTSLFEEHTLIRTELNQAALNSLKAHSRIVSMFRALLQSV